MTFLWVARIVGYIGVGFLVGSSWYPMLLLPAVLAVFVCMAMAMIWALGNYDGH